MGGFQALVFFEKVPTQKQLLKLGNKLFPDNDLNHVSEVPNKEVLHSDICHNGVSVRKNISSLDRFKELKSWGMSHHEAMDEIEEENSCFYAWFRWKHYE